MSLCFSMGNITPSASTIPMSSLASSGVSLPFKWNIPSGFLVFPSQVGGSNVSRGFNFPWVRIPFPRGMSLGEKFPHGEDFPLLIP
jgi:hypothetical protein